MSGRILSTSFSLEIERSSLSIRFTRTSAKWLASRNAPPLSRPLKSITEPVPTKVS